MRPKHYDPHIRPVHTYPYHVWGTVRDRVKQRYHGEYCDSWEEALKVALYWQSPQYNRMTPYKITIEHQYVPEGQETTIWTLLYLHVDFALMEFIWDRPVEYDRF